MLIVGIDGQIGSALATDLRSRGVVVQGTSRKTKCLNETVSFLNLDDQPPELPYAKFSHVVICAGMTNIETCEHNQALCQEINVSGTIALIDRCLESGCFVVYPSSNAVFDGTQAFNKHDDPPNPKSAYGRAKLAIETHLVREPPRQAAVIRFTKIVSPNGGIVEKWRGEAARGETITVYHDKLFSPITLEAALQAIRIVMHRKKPGIFQAGGEREITYFDFAREIFANEPPVLKLLQPVPEPTNKPYHNRHNSLVSNLRITE